MKKIDYTLIDAHSHFLYHVDDGPRDKETSFAMLQTAKEEGIGTIMITSHYHPEKCDMDYDVLKQRFEQFQSEANQMFPDINLVLGREVFYSYDFLEELEAGKKFTMADSRYILIEFDPFTEYAYLYQALNDVIQTGYTPIIAHIERYQCIVNDWERAIDLSDMGVIIQVNAGSVIGSSGSTIKKFVKRLLKRQLVSLIGTDAHSNGRRSPKMKQCAEYLNKKYGYDYAKQILHDNALSIIQGLYLED